MTVAELLLTAAESGCSIRIDDDDIRLSGPVDQLDLETLRAHKPALLEAQADPTEAGASVMDLVVAEVRGLWTAHKEATGEEVWLEPDLDHGLIDDASEAIARGDLDTALPLMVRWRREWRELLGLNQQTLTRSESSAHYDRSPASSNQRR